MWVYDMRLIIKIKYGMKTVYIDKLPDSETILERNQYPSTIKMKLKDMPQEAYSITFQNQIKK